MDHALAIDSFILRETLNRKIIHKSIQPYVNYLRFFEIFRNWYSPWKSLQRPGHTDFALEILQILKKFSFRRLRLDIRVLKPFLYFFFVLLAKLEKIVCLAYVLHFFSCLSFETSIFLFYQFWFWNEWFFCHRIVTLMLSFSYRVSNFMPKALNSLFMIWICSSNKSIKLDVSLIEKFLELLAV